MLRSGSGYLSSSELVLTFGLGKTGQADEIELRWPSGQVDKLSKVAAGQTITVKEGAGIVQQRAFGAPRRLRSQWADNARPLDEASHAAVGLRTAGSLRTRKISALELADEYIRQIERLNPKLNALVDFDPERVRKQARASDPAIPTASLGWTSGHSKVFDLDRRTSLRDRQPDQSWERSHRRRNGGGAPAEGGRDDSRHHELSGVPDGVRDREPAARPHQQSLEPRLHARRLERRRVGCHCRRHVGRRTGQRQRRLGARAGALHRHLLAQADARPHSRRWTSAAVRRAVFVSRRDRPDGAHDRRCGAVVSCTLGARPRRSREPADQLRKPERR